MEILSFHLLESFTFRMAPVTPTASAMAADFDVIQNRVAVALAKRERLIKSWTASSSRPRPPPMTQEELDAEDVDLFNPTPAGLGLGAPIPKEFLDGDVKRKEISTNDKLRHLVLGKRGGLQASKPRDGKEKAGSAKRGLKEESSDEDQGRSALGKAKKSKNRNASNTVNASFKDGAKAEHKQEVKSTSQEKFTREPSHVFRSEVKPQVKLDQTEIPQEKPSLQKSKIQAASKKKPLVDYGSDDESDYHGSEPISAASQKKQSSISNIFTVSSSSKKVAIDVLQNVGNHNRSDTTIKFKSATPPNADAVSGRQDVAEQLKHLPHDGIAPARKPSSKSGSSNSSKSLASSTESEPSDMETAIPLALTSDVIGRTSLPASDNITSPIEAKRAKKRQRRARKREREQQRKALALGVASGGAEKSVIASTGGTGVVKKIKDRLLDADGK
jgi:hypothetical protein